MTNARDFLKKKVEVIIDRPVGSNHSEHGYSYDVNYGHVPGTESPDGEELDAYIMGVDKPVEKFEGMCVAVIHRTNDDDDKLIVAPFGLNFSNEEIEEAIDFQERWFKHELIR